MKRKLKMVCRKGYEFVPPCDTAKDGICGEDGNACSIVGYVL